MNIVLTSDNIKSKAIDQKFMEDIAAKLNQAGHKATVYLPVDPNSHIQGMYKAPLDSLIVNIYGGACAGTIYEMGEAWFIKARSTRKVMILWRTQAKDIRGLDWLVRAWDDDFSPESFKGLAHPDEYLTKYGYSFDYQDTVDGATASIIGVIDMATIKEIQTFLKNKGYYKGAIDGIWGPYSIAAAKSYQKANGLVVDGVVGPITLAKMGLKVTAPTRNIGPIQKATEAKLGTFSDFTGFYNKMKGRGYSYYYNDVKTFSQEQGTLANLNCTDATQFGYLLAKEMGYQVKFMHVICPKSGSGHIYMQIYGKEFSKWTDVDLAAAMSAGSQYSIGNRWCSSAAGHEETGAWITSDDGR